MINPEAEVIVPLGKAAELIPGRPHIATLYRWADRRTNPLETIKVGGRRFTSREAIARFIARCSGERAEQPGASSRAERAAAELRGIGVH